MFTAVDHSRKEAIVSLKGTSRPIDYVHNVNTFLGRAFREGFAKACDYFGIPNRNNTAEKYV
jgi:hypothetical protein